MARRIILDVDAGVDDALSVIFALRSPELRVEAITTVAGNADVSSCTRNVELVVQILQPQVLPKIAQGSKEPLRKSLVTAPEVHGRDGLGNVTKEYARPTVPVASERAVDLLLKIAHQYPGEVVLVPTGPLTNVAKAFLKSRARFALFRELIIMGGAFYHRGNTGPLAEFNMFVDPEAASTVMNSGQRITLIPLNVTEKALLRRTDFTLSRHRRSSLVKFMKKFATFTMNYHQRTEGFQGLYLHDPLTVAVAMDRSLVRCKRVHVDVDTRSGMTRGLTVAYPHDESRRRPAVDVALEVNVERFRKLFLSRVVR